MRQTAGLRENWCSFSATSGIPPWMKASWPHGCEKDDGPHEANFLKLDCSLMKSTFSWEPRWNVETAMEKIVEWNKAYFEGRDVVSVMDSQIREYLGL